MNNFQRIGSQSNAKVGSDFEKLAKDFIESKLKVNLGQSFSIAIGLPERDKKQHNFDLGNENILVECKSHKWTSGDNVPSAKLTVWNEAMYYFLVSPNDYRKIFFILKDFSEHRQITLAEYYIRTYKHLIPNDV